MAKNKAKLRSDQLFQSLIKMSTSGREMAVHDQSYEPVIALKGLEKSSIQDSSKLPRMKKFRFQLLHHWMSQMFEPCKAADIGGGKGLLSFLLVQSGWDMTVIDPFKQALPDKYKDIHSGTRVKIDPQETVPHMQTEFEPHHAQGFDLLIGMHAHGCNAKIIEAAAAYGCGFMLFPCCIIDEPFYPPLGVHWLESLVDYALRQGHEIYPFRLNFKGQNIGFYSLGKQKTKLGSPLNEDLNP